MSVKHSDMTYHQDCQTIFKARAYRWVHADGVNALSHIIVSMQLADLLGFQYCFGSKAAMFPVLEWLPVTSAVGG